MAAKNGRTTIKIDPEVLAEAKRQAASQGITLSSLIEERLLQGQTAREPNVGQKYVPLPSFSSGSTPHTLTPQQLREVQAADDLAYARKFKFGVFAGTPEE